MINNIFLLGIKNTFISILNFFLDQEEKSSISLKKHTGKILSIKWDSKIISLVINNEGKFELASNSNDPQVVIYFKSNIFNIINLIVNKNSIMSDIYVSGEVSLSALIGKITQELRIDLEDILAKKVGDLTTIVLLKFFRKLKDDFLLFNETFKENIIDYLTEEKKILLGKTVFNRHISDQEKIHLSLKNLEKKYNHLFSNVKKI